MDRDAAPPGGRSDAAPPAGARFLEGFTLRRLPKGQLLCAPSSGADQVFMVHSGRLRVFLASESRELSLSFLEAGDFFSTHTPTYIQAAADSSLWIADTARFARAMADDPSIAPMMLRVLGRLLASSVHMIEDLAFRDVPARLARFLLHLAERRGETLDGRCRVPLALSMQEMADLVGTTRQTLSTLINAWERDGIIARQGRGTLVILAPDALRAAMGR